MTKTVFTYDESPYHPGYYTIMINHDAFYLFSTKGSFNIICARLLNMSYASYRRFCRDILGATIIGKGTKYPVPYFKKGENLFPLVKLLNARANLVIFEREHPDYSIHEEAVKSYMNKIKETTKNVPHS